jgi:hypothetical protein
MFKGGSFMRRYSILVLFILSQVMGQLQSRGDTVYFLVGKPLGCPDSYVLPLNNPDDIEHARQIIKHHGVYSQPLVVARISHVDVNKININRNYCVSPAPSWSWYVKEFLGFADVTAEILDGTPTQVENGTFDGNTIGFWTYTVKAELGTELNPWCEVLEPDCVADFSDLAILASHWLEENCVYPGWCGSADLNVSGTVDFFDFALLANKYLADN